MNSLHSRLGDSFKKIKSYIYKHCQEGFYIFAKPNLCDPKTVTKYIGRYLGRPVIATSRIDAYDGENVTFHYNRHEDNALITTTMSALSFMNLLIQHIPEKHFKMIRYYGIYARHRDLDNHLFRMISKEVRPILLQFNKWRASILSSFGYDPLKCPKCGKTMEILEIYYNHRPVSLQELYEKAMSKYKCRSPAKKKSIFSLSTS